LNFYRTTSHQSLGDPPIESKVLEFSYLEVCATFISGGQSPPVVLEKAQVNDGAYDGVRLLRSVLKHKLCPIAVVVRVDSIRVWRHLIWLQDFRRLPQLFSIICMVLHHAFPQCIKGGGFLSYMTQYST
jgi:hypothetical protein